MTTPSFSNSPPNPPDDAWLEAALREHRADYIDDAGFSMQVLANLPPSRRRVDHRRTWLVLAAAALGCAAAGWLGGAGIVSAAGQVEAWLGGALEAASAGGAALPAIVAANLVFVTIGACWALARGH